MAKNIYFISKNDLLSKDFGTKDQIRRASLSISSNIAEGFEYNNNKQFIRYLNYAKGSSGELRSQLYLLKEVGYINNDDFDNLLSKTIELSKKIKSLINYLQSKL